MGHKWTRPADGRHTYASLALASGKSIRWVAAQLGHSNPELTLRVYAHAMPEGSCSARERAGGFRTLGRTRVRGRTFSLGRSPKQHGGLECSDLLGVEYRRVLRQRG